MHPAAPPFLPNYQHHLVTIKRVILLTSLENRTVQFSYFLVFLLTRQILRCKKARESLMSGFNIPDVVTS